MIKKPFLTILFIAVFSVLSPNIMAQDIEKDSIITPFRKGRWLTGLSGSIGSSSTENSDLNEKSISNRYSIEISLGKFIMDRLSIGFTTDMERKNIENETGSNVRTTENIFIGPTSSYYLSKSEVGSLFFSLSPGVVLYRDRTGILREDNFIENLSNGTGFGILSTFGYSYVIYDRIAFDLGLNWSVYWIGTEQELLPGENINSINLTISDFSFSFGFKVLVD